MSISNAFKLALQKASNMFYDGRSSGLTATDLQAAIDEAYAKASPISEVKYFARNTAPDGWIKADGSAVSRTTYSALFAVIGTTFGEGDGSTTFNLPDLRGEFIRGWDDDRGVDSGRVFGSSQLDQMQKITGTTAEFLREGSTTTGAFTNTSVVKNTYYAASAAPGSAVTIAFDSANSPEARTSSTTSGETRSRNVALLACIKY